ncbi:unnamed protein product [Thlaspi arvense]|uniref:Thioredoxin domain-containing protein n=1 Tax=Thlaspi arvense TaxID=13288 RepID=A0AAU9RR52_THLAR|nr:unnamed protein product [Thlaspi arvense]
MAKREIYSTVFIVIYLVGVCSDGMLGANAQTYPFDISADDWDDLVLKSEFPVLVMYTTLPCSKSPDTSYTETCSVNQEHLNNVANHFIGRINMYRIDVGDYPWFEPTAIEFGMKGKDTFAIIDGGKLKDTLVFRSDSEEELLMFISGYLGSLPNSYL